jgi:Cyclic nucleotide-binding domain/Major Facilitator Superfamily
MVLRNPDMRRLQFAWLAASLSMWAFAISLGVYAFEVGGATAVGIAALVRLLPGALASPLAGLLGDRHSRRSVLLASALGAACVLACASVAAALGAPAAAVFGLAGLFTVAISPYVPAEGALMPIAARTPQELSAANVTHSVMDNLGFLAGSLMAAGLLTVASPEAAFALASAVGGISAILLARLRRDQRPAYAVHAEVGGVLAETARGARALLADPALRVVGAGLILLLFFEGAADVLVVILALDLLGLDQGSVGYLNAAWGVGALLGGAALAQLLDRGHLAAGLVLGSVVAGISMALPGLWVVAVAGYIAWLGMGVGYTLFEVAARTLMQRLGSDETLARALAFLETGRLGAMALGSIAVPGLIALLGIEGTLIAVGALLPAFALLRWSSLRALEIGAPVEEGHFRLLRQNPIFAPLPIDTLERLSHDLVPLGAVAGEQIVRQGEPGKRFYLIEAGQVEVYENGDFRCAQSEGDSFGEIALLNDVPRTATVRAVGECRLLVLERTHFISAVTGHRRSHEAAGSVIEERLTGSGQPPPPR